MRTPTDDRVEQVRRTPLGLGTRIGSRLVEPALGRGGRGDVFLARDGGDLEIDGSILVGQHPPAERAERERPRTGSDAAGDRYDRGPP